MSAEGQKRARHFVRCLAAQTMGCLVCTQLVIIALGMIIRAIDKQEVLVQLFNFPQDAGQDQPGDFWNALHHHKLTYYVSGLILLLAILGVGVIFALIVSACSSEGGAMCCRVWCECCMPRYDCCRGWHSPAADVARACSDCADSCNARDCSCPCVDRIGSRGSSSNRNGQGNALFMFVIVAVIVLAIIGLLAAIVALVMGIQKACQKYIQLQQLGVLAQEYIVLDLAEPTDMGDAEGAQPGPPSQQGMPAPDPEQALLKFADIPEPSDPKKQIELQVQIQTEINEILGDALPDPIAEQALRSAYGSTY